jgi:fucose 4-O-acetylase-like acetyltransferase
VWPYVVFSILGASVLGLSSNKSYYIFVSGAIADAMKFQDSIDTPLWFLLALFSASVCFRMLSALPKAVVGCVSLVLFFLSIYVSGFLGFDLPFRLISSLQYVVFLYCGYCAALYCGIDFLTRFGPGLKRSANLALYVVGIIFICAIVDGMGVMITSIGFLATSILGSLMVVELSLMIFRWRFFSSILGWCGRNSLGILCVHELVMISVRKFLTPILGRGIDQISMVLFIFLLVLLFAKRFPFLYKMPLGIPYFHKHDRTSM